MKLDFNAAFQLRVKSLQSDLKDRCILIIIVDTREVKVLDSHKFYLAIEIAIDSEL